MSSIKFNFRDVVYTTSKYSSQLKVIKDTLTGIGFVTALYGNDHEPVLNKSGTLSVTKAKCKDCGNIRRICMNTNRKFYCLQCRGTVSRMKVDDETMQILSSDDKYVYVKIRFNRRSFYHTKDSFTTYIKKKLGSLV